MTETGEQSIYSQPITFSDLNNNESINYNRYLNFIRYITPEIINELNERGWVENARNKVIVRYIANGKWQSLTNDQHRIWNTTFYSLH